MSKRLVSVLLILCLLFLVGCGTTTQGSSTVAPVTTQTTKATTTQETSELKEMTIRIAHVLDTKNNLHKGLLKFQEMVDVESNGKLKIEIYPNSQLGGERDIIEGVRLGTLEMCVCSSTLLTATLPQAGVFGLPYLYTGAEQALKVVTGPIGEKFLTQTLPTVGIRGLAFYHAGLRHIFTTKKEVHSLADFQGIKLRIQEDPMQKETFSAMGASPVPIPYPELYTSLQSGVIDAAEQPLASLLTMKFFEVSKYLILTGHTYQVYISMINDNFWKKLDPRAQVILEKAAKETGLYQYEISKADNAAARAELEKLGMKFIEVNVSDFQNAVLPVTEKYAAKIEGGLEFLEAVRNTK